MRGMRSADTLIATFPSAAALPADAKAVLDAAALGLFGTQAWWETVLSHATPPGAQAVFVTVRLSGKIAAVVPLLRGGGKLTGFTTPYTCAFTPALADRLDEYGRVAAMTALTGFSRRAGVFRLDALPMDWNGLGALEAGARRAGLITLRFDHFGNWYEDVAGLDWAGYLARRPGALRETIRRRLRRAEKQPGARFDLFTTLAEVDQAAAAFESVYGRSWKDREPFPTFNVALMRATAASGQLRLGVWSIGTDPVAVQFWVVIDGEAIVLKLAHDEGFKAYSPGTVLTALMLRHLLDHDGITRIDFGRGDDDYKKAWAKDRRQRIGVLVINPWCISGAQELLRHAAGRLRSMFR